LRFEHENYRLFLSEVIHFLKISSTKQTPGSLLLFFVISLMRKIKVVWVIYSLLFALFPFLASGQILHPAKWSTAVSSQNIKVGDEIDLIFKADIDKNWYLYSSDFDASCGPMVTAYNFKADKSYALVGGIKPINPILKHDEVFGCDVKIFKKQGEFRQKIKILSTNLKIEGDIEYQVCTDIDGSCIPSNEDFAFTNLKVTGAPVQQSAADEPSLPQSTKETPIPTTDVNKPIELTKDAVGPILDEALVKNERKQESFFGFFILAFLAGLAALLTPCVFPMIPMTVSFFTTGKSKALALFYGASIVLIYTLIGALLAPLMGPETANHLSTEWLPNLLFFSVFVFFALSFLGLFEITLPGTFINKVDQQAEKGGFVGVFFMAFTLVLVSFSCTGPLVGSILVSSAGGEFLKPIVGMFGFSLAFAIPFTLFAIFPGMMKSLPKSGGWLNSVKVVLGFLEIALAFKFLSIADQAFHWHILDREVNIAIWIVIASLIGVYLLKALRLPGDIGKDVEEKRVGVPRLILAILVFTFVVYLIPGMWGAPLKALAGYLPPLATHDFDLVALGRKDKPNEICETPKYADFLHLPHGLNGYFDYKQALACAREQHKPLFIDFTGHGCTNCREMEAVVWSDPQVLQRLKNDFVVVALYVDDKTELPESEWYTSSYDKKVKKTIGKQNADLQIDKLKNNAQPFYVLVGEDERVLVSPYSFDRSPEEFVNFLEAGKAKYKDLYK
jgi:thiol:disulfide interchange protein